MGGNPTLLGQEIGETSEGWLFVLDDDRHTARESIMIWCLIFPTGFCSVSGMDLREDLFNRDFTINAMAVPVDRLTQVIDPLGGQSDLERGVLRACSEHALFDDPVRVLRGVRLAVQLDLDYAPGLEQALQSRSQLTRPRVNANAMSSFGFYQGQIRRKVGTFPTPGNW